MELTVSNYYSLQANKKYFSVSQYKDFMKCEAMAMAKISGSWEQPVTKALLVGSFVDAYFEGTLEEFMKNHSTLFTKRNELKAEFKKANEIIGRIKADTTFCQYMSGEKQKILTFRLFGTDWKMKMDSFSPEKCITDLKVVANFKTLPYWRYDLQGALYQTGAECSGFGKLPFYLAVVTKEKVMDLDIFQIPQSTLDMALKEIESHMPRFLDVKNGFEAPVYCGKCDYCKTIKRATVRSYNELLEG